MRSCPPSSSWTPVRAALSPPHAGGVPGRAVRSARYPKADPGNPVHLFQQYAVTAQGYTAIAETLLDERFDLLLVYYEQVDSFSHLFMKYAAPRLEWIPEEDHERFRDVVVEWYAYQDELLGRLLGKIDLDETAVFVLSDHGFKSGDRRIRSEQTVDIEKAHLDHEADGIFVAAGRGIRRGGRVADATVLDVTPTVLHYLGLPVGKDMDGKVLTGIFDDEDPIEYVASYEPAERRAAECIRLYGAAIELHDGMPALYLGQGDCLERAGRFAEAEATFTRALELDPDWFAAIYNLGVTAFQQGDDARAVERYEQALALDPQHPLAAAALNNLGTVHLDRGELDLAVARWEQAVALSPALLEARFNLAAQYLDQGRIDDAIPLLEQAARLAPNHELVHTRLARAYMEKGRGDDAYRALTLVHRLYPENWFAPLGLAVLYAATDQTERAEALLADALRLGGDVARTTASGYPALAPLLEAE